MYRGILGDCFLLMVGPPEARSHILIDCGVLQGVQGGKTRMEAIVADIAETTNRTIDLLIVTHEHFDHIGGFKYAKAAFAGITIKALWFAWTEDPDDTEAGQLRERFGAADQQMAALRMQIAALSMRVGGSAAPAPAAAPAAIDPDAKRILGLAGFRVNDADDPALAVSGAPRGSKAIYDDLRDWVKKGAGGAGKPDYLLPGDVLDTPGPAALRAYVLGPPKNVKLLTKSLPSSNDAKETYLAATAEIKTVSSGSPFSRRYRWATRDQLTGEGPAETFIRDTYLLPKAPCRHAGDEDPPLNHRCDVDFLCGRAQGYRAIDDTPALAAGTLALKMDSNTNNTSLVIAFELPGDGVDGSRPTMLFAADAQVGNWLSWETVKFQDRVTKASVDETAAALLSRAVLYKVGHHGSHNATLRAKGLELMTGGALVAMIPTVEAVALEQGSRGWLMPNPETYKGLIRQTRGRILRGDLTTKDNAVRAEIETLIADKPEFDGFKLEDIDPEALTETELYVDYTVTP